MYRAAVSIVAILLAPVFAYAQTAACGPVAPVSMTITGDLDKTTAGSDVGYVVRLQNNSENLVHDANIAVQLISNARQDAVVRFTLPEAIALLPESTGQTAISIPVPADTESGMYTVYATLIVPGTTRADAYSRVQQPFASAPLAVTGATDAIYVKALQINGSGFQPHAIVRMTPGDQKLTANIANDTDAPYIGTVTWNVYAATSTVLSAPLASYQEPIELHPHTSGPVSYTFHNATATGYYIETTLAHGASKDAYDLWLRSDSVTFRELLCHARGSAASSSPWRLWLSVALLVAAAALVYAGRYTTHTSK